MAGRLLVNIHSVIPLSRVNGPGTRMVIFFQGCTRKCAGCFNPDTHQRDGGELVGVDALFAEHLSADAEGVTVSGGEPFSQPYALLELLKRARREDISTMVYTGFAFEELQGREATRAPLALIDVLVSGAYEQERREGTLLARGSTNQRFHFLTGRYRLEDLYMPGKIEITIGEDGVITETGFGQLSL